tara:strand:+ start:163 stop:720 length:558 start_codon:yes stop_codon:yes gene_type:complete
MKNYKVLKNKKFSYGDYNLVPLRDRDKFVIMKWRNEQIDFLRQGKILTEKDQLNYFKKTISKLYNQTFPNQLLFSLIKENICIGYGGLVHINWNDKNAEISFIMDTELEKKYFKEIWAVFLKMLDLIAFNELYFNKIYTYAYDLRPLLYDVLEDSGYIKEAVLKNHFEFKSDLKDIVIHSKFNKS